MAFECGKYGIYYNPERDEEESSPLSLAIKLIVAAALIVISVSIFRGCSKKDSLSDAVFVLKAPDTVRAPSQTNIIDKSVANSEPIKIKVNNYDNRPAQLRTLMMRLESSSSSDDQISTIEKIRALPGNPAADNDNELARLLGRLNTEKLFVRKHSSWVITVIVKSGDNATRIAQRYGTSVELLKKLNSLKSENMLKLGQKLYVMNHPRCSLTINKNAKIADLNLNGKFFKRYDLKKAPIAKSGAYELSARRQETWTALGAEFSPADLKEINMIIPAGSNIIISDF